MAYQILFEAEMVNTHAPYTLMTRFANWAAARNARAKAARTQQTGEEEPDVAMGDREQHSLVALDFVFDGSPDADEVPSDGEDDRAAEEGPTVKCNRGEEGDVEHDASSALASARTGAPLQVLQANQI